MKFTIIGLGNFGRVLAEELTALGHEVVGADIEMAKVDAVKATLVAALVQGMDATVVNVGDSRAYRVYQEGISCITVDHSLVQMMVNRGDLTPEQARDYPGKNYITRAIGTESMVLCDTFHLNLQKGDHLLMCTDGLSNMVEDQEMLFEVVHGENQENCCQQLLDIAKNRGAPDNVTCVLVRL